MLFLLWLIARLLTRLLVLSHAEDGTKDLEILVLQHQLRVLRRKTGSCSLLRAGCFPDSGGRRFSLRPRRCCAGTARWSDKSGPTAAIARLAGRRSIHGSGGHRTSTLERGGVAMRSAASSTSITRSQHDGSGYPRPTVPVKRDPQAERSTPPPLVASDDTRTTSPHPNPPDRVRRAPPPIHPPQGPAPLGPELPAWAAFGRQTQVHPADGHPARQGRPAGRRLRAGAGAA